MNGLTVAVLIAASGFAIGNWISRAVPQETWARPLEYVSKPATLALLVVAALTLDPESGSMRTWFVVALLCSLAGDVFLMLPSDRFVEGLGSFLLGHVAYVAGFLALGIEAGPAAIAAVAVAVAVGPVGLRIVRGATSHDSRLTVPVAAYITVISAMIVAAGGSTRPLAIVGAVSFAFSDSLIGWTRFVRPAGFAPVTIMVTYHLGQAFLVFSLV